MNPNQEILDSYEERVGMHQDLFKEAVLERVTRILGKESLTTHSVLEELVETISWLTPKEIPSFLHTTISDETFEYQLERPMILTGRHRLIRDFAFHINTASLLDSSGGVLTPSYILDRRPYDPSDWDFDDYRVCFAKGTIGDLAVFLAGHVFLHPDNVDSIERQRFDPNHPYFSQHYKIGVVNASLVSPSEGGDHIIQTAYSGDVPSSDIDDPHNVIQVRESHERTPLETTLTIPYIVWTPHQTHKCEEEAKRYLAERKPTDMGSVEEYVRLFVAERKLEHEVMYALHNFLAK